MKNQFKKGGITAILKTVGNTSFYEVYNSNNQQIGRTDSEFDFVIQSNTPVKMSFDDLKSLATITVYIIAELLKNSPLAI